jgi:hypothetical protein
VRLRIQRETFVKLPGTSVTAIFIRTSVMSPTDSALDQHRDWIRSNLHSHFADPYKLAPALLSLLGSDAKS